ncbi:Protein sidekick-2, partial [Trichoplax sp. H2]
SKVEKSSGREFFVGFLRMNSIQPQYITITSYNKPAVVNVTNKFVNTVDEYTIASYESKTLTFANTMNLYITELTSKIVHIVSDEDITVNSFYIYNSALASTLVLPSHLYDKDYVVAAYDKYAFIKLLIIAKYADTHLNISFPVSTYYSGEYYSRSKNLSITLQSSQGFHLKTNKQIPGAIVYSDKDVGVLAGNECAFIPSSTGRCDSTQEFHLPITRLGKNYIISTFADRTAGDIYRVFGGHNNTTVSVKVTSQNYQLSRGDFVEFELNSGNSSYVTCDKPCLVTQFAKGSQTDNTKSDPFMTFVPAIEQYSRDYNTFLPSLLTNVGTDRNYALITIQDKYKNGLMLNGVILQDITWRQILTNTVNETYVTASVPVTIGGIRITHNDSNALYGLINYGWSQNYAGYGHLGGIRIVKIYPYAPRIIEQSSNISVYEGNMTVLECNATSSPISTITWLKDGIPVINYENTTIVEGFYIYSRLVITETFIHDMGNYQCEYVNTVGSTRSNNTSIKVIVYPTITQHPQGANILYGKDYTLNCNGTSYPVSSITWLKNGNPMSDFNNSTFIRNNYIYSRITITNVTLDDQASYRCRYSIAGGITTSNSAIVTVFAIPSFKNPITPNLVPINHTMILQCRGSSLPPVTEISWLRNNTILTQNRYSISLILINNGTEFIGQLKLNSSIGEDAGNYLCNISNGYISSTSPEITVMIQESPWSIRQPHISNVTATNMTVSWLPPAFDGFSPITNYTVRLYNHLNITLNSTCLSSLSNNDCIITSTGTLTIFYHLAPYTTYFLQIWARNAIGASGKEVLSVRTDESAPASSVRNPYALGYNSTSIKIVWQPPNIQNGILAYRVYQWISNSSTNGTIDNSTLIYDGLETEIYSINLHESHTYFYQIIPYNIKYGYNGIASDIINATSHEDAPSSYPQMISAIASSPVTADITWQPPPILDRNGVIIMYNISYDSTQWNENGILQVDGSITTVTLQNLIPFTTYNVALRAATIAGFGPASPTISFITQQSEPSSYPPNLNVTAWTANSIYVSWQPIMLLYRNGIIIAYNISYNSLRWNHRGVLQVNGSTFSAVLHNLLPYSAYNVTVSAATVAGFGPYSLEISATTYQAAPSSYPRNITVIALSSTSIYITWQSLRFVDRNGIITFYTICYNSTQWNDNGVVQVGSSTTNVTVGNLIPFTTYNVTLKAATVIGFGPESPVTSSTTYQSAPSSYPLNLNATALTANSINISWQPVILFNRNGVIITYNVSYNSLQWNHTGIIQVNGTTFNTILYDLIPYTIYNVTINAATAAGFGPNSPYTSTITYQTAPSSYPQNINFTAVSPTSIYVAWQPLRVFDCNGIINSYSINYNSTKWNDHATIYVDSSIMNITIRNLIPFTNYNAVLKAATIAGYGPASSIESATTYQTVPSSYPPNLNTTTLTANSIKVSWHPLMLHNQNGIILTYNISYKSLQWNHTGSIQVSDSDLSTIILELIPYTTYNVSVKAATIAGFGPNSPDVSVVTYEAAPRSYPPDFTISNLSSTSISVKWKPLSPFDRNGIITEYKVVYNATSRQTDGVIRVNDLITSVVIPSLTPYTTYKITVYAATAIGFGPGSPYVVGTTLQSVPRSYPQNDNTISISPTSIYISWQPLSPYDRNGIITSYSIYFNSTRWDDHGYLQFNNSVTSATLQNLIPYTTYKITFRASTIIGFGPKSPPLVSTTHQAVPRSYPPSLNSSAISAAEINISWQPLPLFDRNGVIIMYQLYYNSTQWSDSGVVHINSSLTTAILNGLIPYTKYIISIKAATIAGFGTASPSTSSTTHQSVPRSYPQNIISRIISATVIELSWQPLALFNRNGVIVSYMVYYNSTQWNTNKDFMVNNSTTTVKLTHLSPFTSYNIGIKAATAIGFGPESPTLSSTTYQAAPQSYPQNVKSLAVSASSITLSWQPVLLSDRNGIIIAYKISYNSSRWNDYGNITVNATTTSKLLMNLSPFTVYNITMKAATIIGLGPESPVISVITRQAAPSESPMVQLISLVSNNSVNIRWQVISERFSNGVILGYHFILDNANNKFVSNLTVYENQTFLLGNSRNYTVFNMKYFSKYKISIQAFTIAGVSPRSNEYIINTLESVPSATPVDIRILPTAQGATSAMVVWNVPPINDHNGIITGYRIKYNLLKQPIVDNIIIVGNITQHTLQYLQPQQNYSIQLAASTSVGFGPYSRSIIYETHNAVAPNVTQSPQSISIKAGATLTLECTATGDPIPSVKWMKDGELTSSAYNMLISPGYGKLIIIDVNTGDNGSHWCQFTNVIGSISSAMAVISVKDKNTTDFCLGEVTNDMRWPKTYRGKTALVSCPSSIQGNASRLCSIRSGSLPIWESIDTTGCKSPTFAAMTSLANRLNISGPSVSDEVINELDTATANKTLYGGDIVQTLEIMTKINQVSKIVNTTTLTKFMKVQSNLLNLRNKLAWKYENKFCRDASNNKIPIMDTLEDFASKLNSIPDNETFTTTNDNIAIIVRNLSFSAESVGNLTYVDDAHLATNIEMNIPGLAVQHDQFQKLVVVIYKTLDEVIPSTMEVNRTGTHSVNSHIISTSMYPKINKNLYQPLKITFINKNSTLLSSQSSQRHCTYWQPQSGYCMWETTGCWMGLESNLTHTVCYCNHTTTFATILSNVPITKIKLETTTYIGCGLSSFFLVLTIAIHVIYWRQTHQIFSSINLNIFICLLIANLIIIFGLTRTESKLQCVILATVLHYVLLASFAWMLCQTFYLFKSASRASNTNKACKYFILCTFVLAIAIAVVTAAVTINIAGIDNYIQDNSCWLRTNPPIILIFVISIMLMILGAAITISFGYKNSRKLSIMNNFFHEDEYHIIKKLYLPEATVLLLMLAICWTLFVLFIAFNNTILQHIFAAVCVIKGLYVFTFYGCINIIYHGLKTGEINWCKSRLPYLKNENSTTPNFETSKKEDKASSSSDHRITKYENLYTNGELNQASF